jgi:plasmid stabilization system protein ParE
VTYEVLVRRKAKADIRRAAKWYKYQREGLGKEFVAEVDAAIGRIQANPEQYEVVHREIRHAILRRFPYGIFYRIQTVKISVFAVLHLKRDDIPQKM